MRKLFILQILVALAGLALAVCITPVLHGLLPDDYARLSWIHEWIREETVKPDVAIFGDSRAMNGIDGNLLRNALGGEAVASLTNPGQSLGEAILFYSSLPENTRIVVQCLAIDNLSKAPDISDRKVVRLLLDDYRPDTSTMRMAPPAILQKFGKSWIRTRYEARACVKTGLHNILRDILEPNSLSDSISSPVYPYLYPYERAPRAKYEKYLRSFKKSQQTDSLQINGEIVTVVTQFSRYFRQKGIQYYILLIPLSPLLWDRVPSNYDRSLKGFASQTEVRIFDYTKLIEEDCCFCDPTHPNRAGAVVITKKLAQDLLAD